MFWFTLMLSPTDRPFFPVRSARRHFKYIGLPWSPLLNLQLYFEDFDLINLRTNTIQINQSKALVICDHKSDETRSVTQVNKTYLVWLMFRVLSNQHYQHRSNQKLRSWANAVFQNRGVCGQAVPSFPSPFPIIPFFALVPTFSANSRGNACYAGYISPVSYTHLTLPTKRIV